MTKDPVFTQIIGTERLASQPSLYRFFKRFDKPSTWGFNYSNQELLDKVHQLRASEAIILDLDSTDSDTYGKQESSAFNAHYGTAGFHPLVAFDTDYKIDQ